ncbi:MAG: hypothetical protein M0T70_06115 [Geobacteraceae bacterium]|nr:hypothetical protein [Geobacteraceae bacterium]
MVFNKFDDMAINTILSQWQIDLQLMPPKAKPSYDLTEIALIDLSTFNYISLFDLINLYLIIDFAQAVRGKAHVRFAGLGPYSLHQIMPIDEYNSLKKQNNKSISEDTKLNLEYAKQIYPFISFCHHFGLFESLAYQKKAGSVVFEGISDPLLSKLHTYKGVNQVGSKILKMIPIRAHNDIDSFRINSIISNWLGSLPKEVASAPIFKDGEFSHVFGYQLGLNILEHSGASWRGEYGANGIIAMRVISPSGYCDLRSSFKNVDHIFDVQNDRGILEICVGDRGNGIANTLRDAFSSFKCKYGVKGNDRIDDIIAFAFDELGTRKDYSERLGGVHALHRILKCTAKYGGILKLRTSGHEFIYDATNNNFFERSPNGIGIYPSKTLSTLHPYGSQFQLLLPLSNPTTQKHVIIKRKIEPHISQCDKKIFKVIQIGAYFSGLIDQEINLKLGMLRNSLMEELSSTIIVYDFGSMQLNEDDVVLILSSQKPVLHTHTCICIEVPASLAHSLRDREKLNIDSIDIANENKELFYVLSVKHRTLPMMDTEQRIWWFGLGKYAFDSVINKIFQSSTGVNNKDIISLAKPEDTEIMDLYLKSNEDIFEMIVASNGISWKCRLNIDIFLEAQKNLVRLKLPELMKAVGCIENSGFYKLPSRNDYSDRFIQSTPLMQTSCIANQITDWLISAIKDLIGNSLDVLLIAATGPAELIARSIASNMIGYNAHVINLGYYSAIDHDNLFYKDDWAGVPSVIISDIIDKETTLSQITAFASSNNLKIFGIIAILKLTDLSEETNTLFWDTSPSSVSGDLPRFFIAEYQRPLSLNEQEVESLDKSMFFVEPYSLEVFSFSSLSGKYEEKYPREQLNRSRLQMLEEAKALRSGHWIYGTHHFSVTTCLKKLLMDDFIGGEICGEILGIIISKKIDHVLLPLHSHICDIVQRIETAVKLTVKHDVTFTYCLSTKVLATRPFYVLPKPIKKSIYDNCKLLEKFPDKQLSILILDDAVATGRTLDTIMRSLMLFGRNCISESKLLDPKFSLACSPYKHIHAYAIIDRQGRAKSTMFSGIESISLSDENVISDENTNFSFSFKYDRWLDVDMPVAEKGACELCDEISHLKSMRSSSLIPSDHSAATEIETRLNEIRPQSTEIPSFLNSDGKKLPAPINMGRIIGAETVELVLWEYYILIHRGNPFWGLIKEYVSICEDRPKSVPDFEHNLEYLKTEMGRALFKNWDRMNSQWAGSSWIECLKSEIVKGTSVSKQMLWESGRTLALSSKQHRHLIYDLFDFSVETLIQLSDKEDASGIKRNSIGTGLSLMVISANYYLNNVAQIDSKDILTIIRRLSTTLEIASSIPNKSLLSSMYNDEILSALRKSDNQDSFIPALLTLLNHTIRPSRHPHPHLLPALLSSLLESKVNIAEIKLIRDIVADIKYCLEIVEKRYLNVFDDRAREELPVLKKYLTQLNSEISITKDLISEKSKSIALKILNHYPHQHSNPIFQSLKNTQISIKHIVELIKQKCNDVTPKISLEIESALPDFENIFIIAPSIMTLEEVIINFTSKASFNVSTCNVPKMRIAIRYDQESDSIKKLIIEIFSNSENPESVYRGVISGPGVKETNTRAFRLFRINSFPKKISDSEFTLSIALDFCIGYSH